MDRRRCACVRERKLPSAAGVLANDGNKTLAHRTGVGAADGHACETEEATVAGTDADEKVAALKAIVQTLVGEHYSEENEDEAKRRFLAMAEADLPVAMAIVNEPTEAELDAAFRWPPGWEQRSAKQQRARSC